MALVSLVNPRLVFTDLAGRLLSGGRVYTRVAGTPQAIDTYENNDTNPALNTNPIILDDAGSCRIWVQDAGQIKLDVRDRNDVPIYTIDYAPGVASTESVSAAVTGVRFRSGPSTRTATSAIDKADIGRLIFVNGGLVALPGGMTTTDDGVRLEIHALSTTNLSGLLMGVTGDYPSMMTIGAGDTFEFMWDISRSRWVLFGRK